MSLQAVPNSDRLLCIYPAYINRKKTIAEGRRIAKSKCCDNPTYNEIKDVCAAAGLKPVVENKLYPRELYRGDALVRGRIRVDLTKEDGTLINTNLPNKRALMIHLAEMIPKLKSRSVKAPESSSQSQQTTKSKKKRR